MRYIVYFIHVISILAIALISLSACQSIAANSNNRPDEKRLYIYSSRELKSFLDDAGYSDHRISDISRNLDGTSIVIYLWGKEKAVVVSSDASIHEIDLPKESRRVDNSVLFNDEHQVIAWHYKEKINFTNGISKVEAFKAAEKTNRAGGYFLRDMPSGTAIHAIEKPDIPLAKVMNFYGYKIFSRNGKIFVFGGYKEQSTQEEMYIFHRKGDDLIQEEKLIIHRPSKSPAAFNVIDLNPWDDEVLFRDVYDMPSRSIWYLYNFKTHEMKKIGKVPLFGGWAIFLRCDIIKKANDKLKIDRRNKEVTH